MKRPPVMLYLLLAVVVLVVGTSTMLFVIHTLLTIGAFALGTVLGGVVTLWAVQRSLSRVVKVERPRDCRKGSLPMYDDDWANLYEYNCYFYPGRDCPGWSYGGVCNRLSHDIVRRMPTRDEIEGDTSGD